MTSPLDTTTAARESVPKITVSKDGKWRTFHKHAGLMQFIPSGTYFARAKVDGKIKRQTLGTTVFSTAKEKLRDKLKDFKKAQPTVGTFSEARRLYETDLENDHTLTDGSKRYRKTRIAALLKTWPTLDGTRLEKISVTACREWAKPYSEKFDEQNFNNTLGTLRAIIERGGVGKDANPARKIERLGVKPTLLQLPEPEQFNKLLETIEAGAAGQLSWQSKHCADLVRFLAYSGCRISEARNVTWADVDMERGEIKVHNAKRSRRSNAHPTRQIPIIPPMKQLLERLKVEQNPKPSDKVCVVQQCEIALTAACGMKNGQRLKRLKRGKEVMLGIGIERITHHDLRHLFATRCIEAGVDIPTVSRWLGHSDGGALAMRTYGHLRREHSAAMAQRVTFA